MIVLGIESSSSQGGVAVVGRDGLIAEYVLNIEATYAEHLLPAVDRVFHDARVKIEEVEGLSVALGPGSFTGLRIGLSTVKGLALATGKPVVGVSTLEAMAWSLPYCHYPICPILDARKKEVYCALFEYRGSQLTRLMEDAVLSPHVLVEHVTQPTLFVGDGWRVFGDFLQQALGALAVPPPAFRGASPAAVADLGRRRLLRGEKDPIETLVPRYIRPSEAELRQRGKRGWKG